MSLKNRKRYYVVIFAFAFLLIASVVTIGVLANSLLKKEAKEPTYNIGGVELASLPSECNEDLSLINYSYTDNSTNIQKMYIYETEKGEILIAEYVEYLISNKNFSYDGTSSPNHCSLSQTYSNEDSLVVTLESTTSLLTVTLTYTYGE